MAKNYEIGFSIGAGLNASLGKAIGGARVQIGALGNELKSLAKQRGLIERFEKDQAALSKARLDMAAASREVGRLKLALAKKPGDAKLSQELERAKSAAAKLSENLEKQKNKLRDTDQAMRQSGISVHDLGGQYRKLGLAMEETRKQQALIDKRMGRKDAAGKRMGEMRGQIAAVAGAAYAAGRMLGNAFEFGYDLRLFGNINDMDNAALGKVRSELRALSTAEETNQAPGKLLSALSTLASKGLDPERAVGSLRTIGRAATGAGADIDDLAKTSFSLFDNLKIALDDLPKGLDILAATGKEGSFELRDMSKHFPTLTAQAKSLKLQGTEAIATLGAALQVAMKGAGDPDSAANNLLNFLAKVTAPETVRRFEDMGVDLEEYVKDALAAGKNPLEEVIALIQELTEGDKFRIGELFGDMQVIGFLTPMLQNLEEYKRIKAEALNARGVVDKDYENMLTTGKEAFNAFTTAVSKLGEAFAVTWQPAVVSSLTAMTAVTTWAGDMIERFPWIGKLVGALATGMGVLVGAMFLGTAAVWAFNVALLANPIGLAVAAIVGAAAVVITFWDPIKAFFLDLWDIIEHHPMIMAIKGVKKIADFLGSTVGSLFGDDEPQPAPARIGGSLAPNASASIIDGLPAVKASENSTEMNVHTTVHVAAGADADKVKAAVDASMQESESRFNKAFNEMVHNSRRLGYE